MKIFTNLSTAVIVLLNLCIFSTISYSQNDDVFATYPWLDSKVDATDCKGVTIKVYQEGASDFVFICDISGNHMYDGNGQLYCMSFVGFDCLSFYGFSNQIMSWDCTTTPPQNQDGIFQDFPWLLTLVDPSNCTSEDIVVYLAGVHSFIQVNNDAGSYLYNLNGDLYCTGSPNLDCLEFYGLSIETDTWNCGDEGNGVGGSDCNPPDFNTLTWTSDIGDNFSCEQNYQLFYGCQDGVDLFYWFTDNYTISDLDRAYYDINGTLLCRDAPNSPTDARCTEYYDVMWDFTNPIPVCESGGNNSECDRPDDSLLGWTDGSQSAFACEQGYELYYACQDGEYLFFWTAVDYTIADLNRNYYDINGTLLCSDAPNSPTDARCTEFFDIEWVFGDPIISSFNCSDIYYVPVCGVDGITYKNSCITECAGIEIAYEGECICECEDNYDPVCGYDDITYNNACEANCEVNGYAYEGECIPCIMPTLDELPWLQTLLEDPFYCDCVYEAYPACNDGVSFVALWPRFDSPCLDDDPINYYYSLDGELICTAITSNSDCPDWTNLVVYFGDSIIWNCD